MQDKSGFLYKNDTQRDNEFKAAEYIYSKLPDLKKIPREKEGWESILNRLDLNDFKQLAKFGFGRGAPFEHSHLKEGDLQVAFSRGKLGGLIGEGSFGRVKFATDQAGKIYVVKIEKEQDETSKESEVAKQVGLMKGNKAHRPEDPISGKEEKFYSILEYMGEELYNVLRNNEPSFEQKVSISRQWAWEIHKLHQIGYVHNDIKPDNTVINKFNRPKLIDYGLAKPISEPITYLSGTPGYVPMTKKEVYNRNTAPAEAILLKMTPVEKDMFAFKRSLYLHDIDEIKGEYLFETHELNQLPQALQEIINSMDRDKAILRKDDTPLLLTLHFLAIEFKQDLSKFLSYSNDHQQQLCSNIEKLDHWTDHFPERTVEIDYLRDMLFEAETKEELDFVIEALNDYEAGLPAVIERAVSSPVTTHESTPSSSDSFRSLDSFSEQASVHEGSMESLNTFSKESNSLSTVNLSNSIESVVSSKRKLSELKTLDNEESLSEDPKPYGKI